MSTKKLQILGSLGSGSGSGSSVVIDTTLTQPGKAADAKVTGDYINSLGTQIADVSSLVGDTAVSAQISNAISNITPESIEALPLTGGTLTGGLNMGSTSSTSAVYFVTRRLVGETGNEGRIYINGDTGAFNIQLRVGGSEKNKMILSSTETSFAKPVTISSGGTGASTAAAARANLNVVNKSGDTMTGTLNIGAADNTSNNYFNINRTLNDIQYTTRVYSASTDGSACMSLITVENGTTTTPNRMRLSTTETSFVKPVNVASGGTGANTASKARENLGITSGTTLPESASAGDIFFLYS